MEKRFYGGNSLRFFREVSECNVWLNNNYNVLKQNKLASGFRLPKKSAKLDVLTNIELDKLYIHSQDEIRANKSKITKLLGKQANENVVTKVLGITNEEIEDVGQHTGEIIPKKVIIAHIDPPYDLQEERNLIIDSLPWTQGTFLDSDYPGIVIGSFRSMVPNILISKAAESLDSNKPELITLGGLMIKSRGEN